MRIRCQQTRKLIEPKTRVPAGLNRARFFQILVEYDDVEWQRREWLSPHRDTVFSFFLVEKGLYWAERPDPRHASLIAIDHHNHANNNHHHHRINGKPLRGATAVANTVAWPALVSSSPLLFSPRRKYRTCSNYFSIDIHFQTFYPLVARAELPEDAMPLEFTQDRRLDFVDYSKLKPFTVSTVTIAFHASLFASSINSFGFVGSMILSQADAGLFQVTQSMINARTSILDNIVYRCEFWKLPIFMMHLLLYLLCIC